MRRVVVLVLTFLLSASILPLNNTVASDSWMTSGGGFDSDSLAGHVVLDDGSIIAGGTFSTAI